MKDREPKHFDEQSKDTVTFTEANIQDVGAIVELISNVQMTTYAGVTSEWTEEATRLQFGSPGYKKHLRKILNETIRGGNYGSFVARKGGYIVGYGDTYIKDGDHGAIDGFRIIDKLYITESEQEHGVGSGILSKIIRWHMTHDEAEDENIYLSVVPRTPAVIIYGKWGFNWMGDSKGTRFGSGKTMPFMKMKLIPKRKDAFLASHPER